MKWLFVVLLAIVTTANCSSGAWNKDGTLKPISLQKSETICEPRNTFKYYCNTCKCSSDGKSKACTLMYCDFRIWNEDGTLKLKTSDRSKIEKSEQICKPRSMFKDYCNTCMCSEDGRYVKCPMRVCDARIWNKDGTLRSGQTLITEQHEQACQPYSTFMDYCNFCKCTPDGKTATCTRKTCDYRYLNKDGTSKRLTRFESIKNPIGNNDRIIFKD